jgi:hypothetical protein
VELQWQEFELSYKTIKNLVMWIAVHAAAELKLCAAALIADAL